MVCWPSDRTAGPPADQAGFDVRRGESSFAKPSPSAWLDGFSRFTGQHGLLEDPRLAGLARDRFEQIEPGWATLTLAAGSVKTAASLAAVESMGQFP